MKLALEQVEGGRATRGDKIESTLEQLTRKFALLLHIVCYLWLAWIIHLHPNEVANSKINISKKIVSYFGWLQLMHKESSNQRKALM